MKYIQSIRDAQGKPQQLEMLYQSAVQQDAVDEFTSDLYFCYQQNRDDILLAAWYYRLQSAPAVEKESVHRAVNWKLAIPLAIFTAIIFWILSDRAFAFPQNDIPYLALLWTPISTLGILVYLTLTSKVHFRRAIWIGAGLAVAVVYTFLMVGFIDDEFREHYQILGMIHLALLSWVSVGIYVLGFNSQPTQRFAFLMRSLEVFITGGVYIVVGCMFGFITILLFQALSLELDEIYLRLIFAGGSGLLPLLAVVSIYDPYFLPLEQDFKQGLSRFTATMMRLFLPLTFMVLVIYIFVIPFKFFEPFHNRDVLIIYNIMLFAVMGLLLGATPVGDQDITSKVSHWLMWGIIAVAALTVLVNVYALSAILYRTFIGILTINRVTIIGWNVINISILVAAIVRILRGKREAWIKNIKPVFSRGTVAYAIWGAIVLVVLPLAFL
ncbi:MAG: hypothetical protein JW908_02840 [Anaerolineales bacterium]|nr:hypothetical protein [Anaerolineales bacterium]